MNEVILELKGVSKTFSAGKGGTVHAVRNVDLVLHRGESLGIVGESGCGKSTLVRMVTQLTDVSGGQILLDGQDVTSLPRRDRRQVWRKCQMVFQDPYSVFSPRMPVGTFLEEGLVHYGIMSRSQARRQVPELLRMVELPPELADRLPHQLSGGQQQRVVIARAISIRPQLLILDEATSALDVSVQKQILQLLIRLQKELDLTCLYIGHDLAVVRSVTDRIAVMYAGSIVEELPSAELTECASHPYTRRLLDSVFSVDDRGTKEIQVEELGLETADEVTGCPYAPRCALAQKRCTDACPALQALSADHRVACWFPTVKIGE